jgi:hypothetical protein
MNIHTRAVKAKKTNGKKGASGLKLWVKLLAVFYLVLLMAAFAGITNYRISLNQGIANSDKEAERISRQLTLLDREIENLKLKKEKLSSWPQVRERINKFKLALRMPEHYQVQHLTLIYDNGNSRDTNIVGGIEQKTVMLTRP